MWANFGERLFVYPDGHAHRDAANIAEAESEEEVLALFQVLPFASVISDSEDGVSEEGRAEEEVEEKAEEAEKTLPSGPPCHKLTPAAAG